MLGKKLFTKQTGEQGRICNEVSFIFFFLQWLHVIHFCFFFFCKIIYQATVAKRVDIARPVGNSIGFGSIYQLDPLNNQG